MCDLTHDLKINVGHCDLYFMVQWFCIISWRLFHVWTSSLGTMGQYDRTFDFKINVCHCDLYFVVHWFCLISQRLFDGWVSHFQIMRKYDLNLDLKINIGQHDLSVWHKDWPHQVYVGQWPIFYGPVILLYILKTIWWRNVVLGIMDQCHTRTS